jgi:predicted Zn-dependent protease
LYLCKNCYLNSEKYKKIRRRYYLKHRAKLIQKSREQTASGYRKKLYQKQKLGAPDKIREICKEFNFRNKVIEAIALDGDLLDNELKRKFKDPVRKIEKKIKDPVKKIDKDQSIEQIIKGLHRLAQGESL